MSTGKRLRLSRETIRQLSDAASRSVRGGREPTIINLPTNNPNDTCAPYTWCNQMTCQPSGCPTNCYGIC